MRITLVMGFFLPVPALQGGATEKIWLRLGEGLAAAGHEVGDAHALLDRLNVISATPYERRVGRGRIVIARPDHPAVRYKLRLAAPVPTTAGTRRSRAPCTPPTGAAARPRTSAAPDSPR